MDVGGFLLVLADIDHFKAVNDTYGHQVGDALLAWIGRLFHRHLRHSDVVSRYGGEEFALLLDTDKSRATVIADHLRIAIGQEPGEGLVPVTMSFGVASFGEDGHSFETLLEKADKALYAAKAQGRNRVCVA